MAPPSENAALGVVRLVDELIGRATTARASDVHFEPTDAGLRVRFRVDAQLHDVERIPAELAPNVVARLKVLAGLLTYRIDVPQEGSLTRNTESNGASSDHPSVTGSPPGEVEPVDAEPTRCASGEIRVSTFPTIRGERVVLRFLAREPEIQSLAGLGLSPETCNRLESAMSAGAGLILVTGPAGSGKTTTLYALLRHLLATRPASSIITIEDPVEYRLDSVTQVQVQPHRDFTYARALRSLLRQDPETLLIGEVRDSETAHIAAEAALTGHLLLSTMHSGTPAEAILRLIEMGLPAYQITSTVRLVLSQRLLRTLCDACRRATQDLDEPYAPAGCTECLHSGYRGRTACGEWVAMTPALRGAILAGGDADAIETAAAGAGHVLLREDAVRHVRAGRTTMEELRRASS